MDTTKRLQHSFLFQLLTALAVLLLFFAVSLVLGARTTSLHEAWMALTGGGTGDNATMIREIRLPRIAAGLLVGAALSVSGAIMQGLTRNPLADPGLLGITSGGTAAITVALALMPSMTYLGLTGASFIGAAAGAGLVFGLGQLSRTGLSPLQLVLAGAAVSALLIAVTQGVGLIFHVSKDVTMWTASGLIGIAWAQVRSVAPVIAAGIAGALLLSRQLSILSLNETAATGLGVNAGRVKFVLYLLVVLLAGASVALVGNMAFLGLMVPHIVRAAAGTDYRRILPLSAIAGAAFMVLADTLGRMINAPFETPLVAIVSMVGLPFFLIIVRKGDKLLS
ncbi:iron ABC transporter permease [Paenibacillus spiritus]|uniref:Iron ABC transporter permease n=1 Tax=Paenibacillus spiritus TaxID=2496557 RepID=A0A5J5G934_9BACL|nr:iron ABC transporter permease [Paenibacillus spiritus]KAA9004111.1 iron ABC transporter permease [Paenibacillus spiritus]